jgi:septum formation topological specificity factor MinE
MVFFKLRVYKVCSLVNKDIIFVIHKYAKIVSCMQEIITKAKKSMIILTLFLVC